VGTGCSSCRLTDAASQADARALTLASLSTGLTATMNAVVTRCAPKVTMAQARLRVRFLNVSKHFSESPNAVVDHDGDHLNGDSKCRHPDQDDPDPSEAVFEDGANHRRKATVSSSFRVFLFFFLFAPLHRH
jgi:hypothetical protein